MDVKMLRDWQASGGTALKLTVPPEKKIELISACSDDELKAEFAKVHKRIDEADRIKRTSTCA